MPMSCGIHAECAEVTELRGKMAAVYRAVCNTAGVLVYTELAKRQWADVIG